MDPDFDLLASWRDGDKLAGGKLLDKYHRLIWRTIATKVEHGEIEDLVQRVIVAVLERRDDIRADVKFRAYVVAVTRNVVADFYRRRERKPTDLIGVFESSVRDLGAGISSVVFARQEQRLLLEALRSLPMDDQFVLELHYWENMTGPELGAVFNCLEPTIRGRIARAKTRLKEAMETLSSDHRKLSETIADLDSWARGLREAFRTQMG